MKRLAKGGVTIPLVAFTLLLASLSFLAGPSTSAVASSTKAKTYTITIKNFMFSPMTLKVTPGAKITVVNKDSVTHTMTSTSGKFHTGDIKPHRSKTITMPTKAGTYHYICSIHQYMTGTIIVR